MLALSDMVENGEYHSVHISKVQSRFMNVRYQFVALCLINMWELLQSKILCESLFDVYKYFSPKRVGRLGG